jgi:hypothetical protein
MPESTDAYDTDTLERLDDINEGTVDRRSSTPESILTSTETEFSR